MIPSWLVENPLLVLGLNAQATRAEVERAGQKLLGLLAIGSKSAGGYDSPWGPQKRDEHLVRAALARLRDPGERLRAELWLSGCKAPAQPTNEQLQVEPQEAFALAGWRGRCT